MIGIGLHIGNRVMGGGGAAFDVDAQAFFDRVTVAGGTLTTTEKNATNQLVLDMKSAGIWTAMKAVYPMVGASAAACAQNLKSSSFTGTFSSGWTFASTGATPNGTSAYFDTALNPSTQLTKTTAHLSTYIRTNSNSGQPYDIGNSGNTGATTTPTYLISRYSSDNAYFGIADTSYSTSITSTNSLGFWCGATNGSSTQKLYKNGSSIVSGTAASGGFANNNLYIGANNGAGTATLFSNKQTAFASIGDGLTDTQASNFYTAVQTFNQTLNRQVGPQIVSDADAQAYIDRVYTAGGTLTNTEANAVNQLTIDMKAAGIWTAMKAVYPMVGSSAAACAQNLKSSSFTGTFTSGWTFASTGVTPNGTSAYMDTAFNTNTNQTVNNFSMSAYVRSSNTTAGMTDMGNISLPTYIPLTNLESNGTYRSQFSWDFYVGSGRANITTTDSRGMWGLSRSASNSWLSFERNTTVSNTTTTSASSLPNNNMYIGASNVGGTAGAFSDREIAFAHLANSLTSTQFNNFYTAVQAFQTTLGRQV